MRPSAEARLGVRLLLAVQLVTSLSGVVLLGRMGPAVEHILTENVYSTQAVEEMLVVMAAGGELSTFEASLAKARGNITEPEETPLIANIQAEAQAALAGEAEARAQVLSDLRALSQVNRTSMQQADAEATRLGLAGAWSMALLGVIGFLMSLVVNRRVEERLLQPVLEIDAVLRAVRRGDAQRRCTVSSGIEGSDLMGNVNWLLDRAPPDPAPCEDESLRAALLGLLDTWTRGPALIADVEGRVIASNAAAWDDGAPVAEIALAVSAQQVPDDWSATALREGFWLAQKTPAPPAGRAPG